MRPATAWAIFAKEMRDTFRDRRAVILMFGVPVLLYPGMLMLGFQVAVVQQETLEARASRVAITGDPSGTIAAWADALDRVQVVETPDDPQAALRRGQVEAILEVTHPERALDGQGTTQVRVLYDATEFASQDALARVREGFNEVSRVLRQDRLEAAGLPTSFATPVIVEAKDTATPDKTSGKMLSLLLPLFTVMTLALGAFYPAIDLTAGEKERGTFETLLTTPVTKLEIVAGKFGAVFALALITGLMNLASMFLTFSFLLGQISDMMAAEQALGVSLPPEAFVIILLVMIPLALLISAACMGLAVLARTYREAQHYLSPFFILILMPTFVAAFPGIELSRGLQYVPLANVVLLFKALMTGTVAAESVFAVILSTSAYALIALWAAAWLFQREDVVLAEETGLPITWRRSAFRPRDTLSPGAAMGYYAVVLLLLFYGGTLLQGWRIIPGVILTQWGLLLGPLLFVLWYARVDLRRALLLYRPRTVHLAAALLLGVGWLIISIQISLWHNRFLPVPGDLKEEFAKIFAIGDSLPGLLLLWFAIAVSPAICEEALFRGAILTGLRRRMHGIALVVVVGLLFGIFHLTIYKVIPTALTGAVLTYIALCTGSLWPGVLVHLFINSAALFLESPATPAWVRDGIVAANLEENGLPLWLLAAGILLAVAGAAWLWRLRPVRPRERSVTSS